MKIKRRRFIQQTASVAVATGVSGGLGIFPAPEEAKGRDAAADSLPIVDTHQHLWNLDKFRLPWLEKSEKLKRNFTTKDYLEATRGLNVVKAVYMEVAVAKDQKLAEAEHVVALCRRNDNPTVAAVVGGLVGEEGFRKYILRFKDSPYVKGVRKGISRKELEKPFVEDIRLLGKLGMSFDICMPASRLDVGVKLVDACPDTRFIVDHCGNADPKAFGAKVGQKEAEHAAGQWRRDMAALAKRKNVVCKISGVVARATPGSWSADDLAGIIDHCLEVFGADRVMFGSDWPVCTRVASLREWVAALKEVIRNRDETERRKLLHDNAVRFYGLA